MDGRTQFTNFKKLIIFKALIASSVRHKQNVKVREKVDEAVQSTLVKK